MYKQKINRKVIKINNKQSIIIAAKSLRWIESLPENEKVEKKNNIFFFI